MKTDFEFCQLAHFQRLWQQIGGQAGADELCAALRAAYAEPQRAYHTLAHLQGCLARLAAAPASPYQPVIALALWFHDAIYDPRATDNEEQSAAWAGEALHQGGVAPAIAEEIVALVLATKHTVAAQGAAAELIVDIDLSFLGDAPAQFAEHNRAIRYEYQWVPEAEYRRGRSQILAGFLARPTIYHTPLFYTRFEEQARCNLAGEIARLADPKEKP